MVNTDNIQHIIWNLNEYSMLRITNVQQNSMRVQKLFLTANELGHHQDDALEVDNNRFLSKISP